MLTRIDHVVLIYLNLDHAVSLAEQSGFTVVPGGVHTAGLTHNALIGFEDGSYIEFIAPTRGVDAGEHRWFEPLRRREGLVDYCLGSDDLQADTDALVAADMPYASPQDMGRKTPEGTDIAWRLTMPASAAGETCLPFLIQDTTPREIRVPSTPAATTHPNGVTGISAVHVYAASDDNRDAFVMLGAMALRADGLIGDTGQRIELTESAPSDGVERSGPVQVLLSGGGENGFPMLLDGLSFA